MRYINGRYKDCKWCRGEGCIYCETEAEKEYKRQFPDGPKPIATFKTGNDADVARVIETLFGDKALTAAKSEAAIRAHKTIEENPLVAQLVSQMEGVTIHDAEAALASSMIPQVLEEQIVKASKAGVLIEEKSK